MKKIIPLALVGAVIAMPAMANMDHKDGAMDGKGGDHWFSKMDTNGDGMISKAEHDAFGEKIFREADTNNDNMVSREEMKAYKHKEMAEGGYEHGKMVPSAGGKNAPRLENTIHNQEDRQ